jgi:hypothetical protein
MTELTAIRFHNGRQDPLPQRYVEITVTQNPATPAKPFITIALHDDDNVKSDDIAGIELEIQSEPMELEYAKGKALDLARRSQAFDIFVIQLSPRSPG